MTKELDAKTRSSETDPALQPASGQASSNTTAESSKTARTQAGSSTHGSTQGVTPETKKAHHFFERCSELLQTGNDTPDAHDADQTVDWVVNSTWEISRAQTHLEIARSSLRSAFEALHTIPHERFPADLVNHALKALKAPWKGIAGLLRSNHIYHEEQAAGLSQAGKTQDKGKGRAKVEDPNGQ